MIAIIDYKAGNIGSVKNALNILGIKAQVTHDERIVQKADGIIFPGVGAAGVGMENLKKNKLENIICEQVRNNKPFLGICLGMQLLFSNSEENKTDCLDIIKGTVKKFVISEKVPHIGWNQVKFNYKNSKKSGLFKDIPNNSYFYFVHSYYCKPDDVTVETGTTDYGIEFCSTLQKDNVYAVQFHPEKSGETGLQLLKNFKSLC